MLALLIVLKFVKAEDEHENHKEITDNKLVLNVQSMLRNGDWEKVKLGMTRPSDYQIYF